MRMRVTIYLSLFLQLALLVGFFYFGHKADLAMDIKTGIGDYYLWDYYSRIGDKYLLGAFVIWFSTNVVAFKRKLYGQRIVQLSISAPFVIFVLGAFSSF